MITKLFTGKQPDITPGQVCALLTFLGTQAVAYGWLTNQREQTLLSVGGIIVSTAWKIADALLRGSRAKANAMSKSHG